MFETIERLCENPFLCGLLITILLSLIFYLFLAPYLEEFPPRRIIIKAYIYMYVSSLFLLYMHSKTVKNFYEKRAQERIGLVSINKSGSNELEFAPNLPVVTNPIPSTYANANEFL